MKNISISTLSIALLSLAALSGCSTLHADGKYTSREQPTTPPGFVQQEMNETISSIERSLRVLVELERGDEGPRNPNPIGTTVAGAVTDKKATVPMARQAHPDTPAGQQRIAEQRAASFRDLETRIKLKWTGDADELLRELSKRIGFSYSGGVTTQVVTVDFKDATVREVLSEVARQVNTVADVKLDVAKRHLELSKKSQ